MNALLRITSGELRSLFVSPVAWVLLIIFIIQTSARFLEGGLARFLDMQLRGDMDYNSAALYLFESYHLGIVRVVQDNLIFYIPLLTMGLLAREFQSGSIKLLLSSPLGVGQIVLGKYIAVVAYIFLMIVFLLGLLVLSMPLAPNLDASLALAGFLGVFLLACTYASVGLFMSSLTSHQIVAAISTVAILAGLSFMASAGQRIPVLNEVLYWLSMDGRADTMREGLIGTNDIAYFIAITVLFLGLTCLRLLFSRRTEAFVGRAMKVSALVAAVLAAGIITSRPALTFYWDATFNNRQTLSPESQDIMARLEGPWHVTVYSNIFHPQWSEFYRPSQRKQDFRRIFQNYLRENHEMRIDYKYFYGPSDNQELYAQYPSLSHAEIAQEFARQNRLNFDRLLPFEEAREAIGWRADIAETAGFYVLEWQGRREVVGTFRDNYHRPSAAELSAAMRRLIEGPYTVAYATDHDARGFLIPGLTSHYATIRDVPSRRALINQGFDFEEITLSRPIPDHVDTLVIADPMRAYSDEEAARLSDYIASGRDLMVMVEPGRAEYLAPVLNELGVTVRPGGPVSQGRPQPELVLGEFTEAGNAACFGFLYSTSPILFNGVLALEASPDSTFRSTPVVSADLADRASPVILALALERNAEGRTQRVMVIGDADPFSAGLSGLGHAVFGSLEMMSDSFRFLSHDRYPVSLDRAPAGVTYVTDNRINLRLDQVDYLKMALYGVLPGTLLLLCFAFLLYRRRF